MADALYRGPIPADDQEAMREYGTVLREIEEWNSHVWTSTVNGELSFRLLLGKLGVDVPETMTEAGAAALFLEKAERFSEVLAQWQGDAGATDLGNEHPAPRLGHEICAFKFPVGSCPIDGDDGTNALALVNSIAGR